MGVGVAGPKGERAEVAPLRLVEAFEGQLVAAGTHDVGPGADPDQLSVLQHGEMGDTFLRHALDGRSEEHTSELQSH